MTKYGEIRSSVTDSSEHVQINAQGTGAKRVLLSGYDGTNFNDANVNKSGSILVNINDSGQLDAFSRLRVSNPTTLFDSKFRYDTLPIRFNSITANSGSITHLPNECSVSLATAAVASSSAIIQSKQYHKYIPGKSQLIFMTGVIKTGVSGITKRVGYFDADDGIFFEQNGTTDIAVVRRTSTSGSPVDNRVAQSSWNIDKLDGTGVSGKTLDVSKCYILVIDLQWLGMGRVRIGFDIDGTICYVHQFLNANSLTTVYMKKSDLPVRWEIAGNGVATMQATCSSVISEGGSEDDEGFLFSADNGTTVRTVTAGTPLPVIAIRPATTFNSITNRLNFRLEGFNWIPSSGTGVYKWELIYNPTVTGGSWSSVGASTAMERNVTGTSVNGGIVIASGYDNASSGVRQSHELRLGIASRFPFCYDGANNQIVYALVFTDLSATTDISASITWRELR